MGSKPVATRPRRRSSPMNSRCDRASSLRRPICTRASAAWCRRSRRGPTSGTCLPVIDEALDRAGIGLADVGCVAVHNTPGLVGALLVGVSAAKMLALALGVPLVAVNHIQSHIYACRLAAGRDIFPCVGLVVSGGHTALFRCDSRVVHDPSRRHARRRGRRSLRQGRGDSRARLPRRPGGRARGRQRQPEGLRFPARLPRRRPARVQLQRTQDRRALRLPRPGREPGDAARRPGRSAPTSRRASRPRSWMCWRSSASRRSARPG